MKFKFLLTLAFAAGASLSLMAQGYKDGVEYFKADRLTNAEELLTRNLNNADTDKSTVYYYLGQIQLARYYSVKRTNSGNPATYKNEAAAYFEKGLQADPENPFNYIGVGHIDLIDGNSKLAEDNFKKAEKLGKKDAGIYAGIARAYYDVNPTIYAKQMQKAIASGQKLVQKQALSSKPEWAENDQDFYMFMGDMAFDSSNGDSKKVGDACNFYESAIRVNPQAAEGYIKYADKLLTVKRVNEALTQLRTLLQNNPNSALGQRELAENLYEDGQIVKGIEEYGKLIKNPNHFKSDEDRYMTLLYFVNDYQKGYDEATALLKANPDNFSARRFQYIFAHALEMPEALAMGEQLLKLKSDTNRFATGDFALIAGDMIKAGRNDEAVSVLDMGLKEYPKEPSVAKGASRIYFYDLKQYDKAADYMQQFADLAADEATATDLYMLSTYAYYAAQTAPEGDAAAKDKYLNMSADAIQKADAKFSKEYKYQTPKRMADIAMLRGDNAKAEQEYLKAIALIESDGINDDNKSDLATMYRALGVAYVKDKKNAEARNYFQKYLGINPNDADVAKLVNQLK